MSLPYDIARCSGTQACHLCQDCRRTEPGRPERQVMISPELSALIGVQHCKNYIKPEVRRD